MKTFACLMAVLTLFILLENCSAPQAPLRESVPATTPSGQVATLHPTLVLKGTTNASQSEIVLLDWALNTANRKLGSTCFKDAVLKASFTETKGTSQAQLYELLSKAPSELSVEIFDGSFWENHFSKTVAYEGTGAKIRLNRFFLRTPESIAATYVHERLGHGNGFSHFGIKKTSIPYGLQHAMENCQ